MTILVITGLFPTHSNPTSGIFFANLLLRLKAHVERIVVVSPVICATKYLRQVISMPASREGQAHQRWGEIELYRPLYPCFLRPSKHLWHQARSMCLSSWRLCHALHQRYSFDIVLGNEIGASAHTAQALAKSFACPSICWAIGSDVHTAPHNSAENLRLLKHNIRYNDLVLTTSKALRQEALRICPHAGHIHTFYRGVDLSGLRDVPDKRIIRNRLGVKADRVYMLSAGAAKKSKGTQEFYESFRRLAHVQERLAAIWIGSGPQTGCLRQQAEQDGLADRFILTGRLTRPEVLEYMKAADLLVFASHAEGLPNVVMEGMASTLPVVATNVGGTCEIIANGVNGLLVAPHNVSELVEGIRQILTYPQQAAKMAQEARHFIFRYFDVAHNARVLADVLQGLLGGSNREASIPPCAGIEPGRLPIDTLRALGSPSPSRARGNRPRTRGN